MDACALPVVREEKAVPAVGLLKAAAHLLHGQKGLGWVNLILRDLQEAEPVMDHWIRDLIYQNLVAYQETEPSVILVLARRRNFALDGTACIAHNMAAGNQEEHTYGCRGVVAGVGNHILERNTAVVAVQAVAELPAAAVRCGQDQVLLQP